MERTESGCRYVALVVWNGRRSYDTYHQRFFGARCSHCLSDLQGGSNNDL